VKFGSPPGVVPTNYVYEDRSHLHQDLRVLHQTVAET
jgi:hypothetical protein